MAPFDFSRSSRALVVSSARACDDPTIKAEKAQAAHKRAIVVWCLPLIRSPQSNVAKSYTHATLPKSNVHGIASGSVSQHEQNTRKFNCPLPNPDFRWKYQRSPALTSRSLEAHSDPKPDSSPVTLEMKDSRHFWESVT